LLTSAEKKSAECEPLFWEASLRIRFVLLPHPVFDVVVDDEIEFFGGEAIMMT